jgi:hypothetical protein
VVHTVSETFVSGILTASVTGAGLVIAYYAFVASMADRMFQRRVNKLEQKHEEIKKIREDTQAFETANLEKTTKKLKTLSDAVNEISIFPSHLGIFVFIDFMLFIFSAVFAFNWLDIDPAFRTNDPWLLLAGTFLAAIGGLMLVGGSGILEVYRLMKERFEELKKDKEDAQRDARSLEPTPPPK